MTRLPARCARRQTNEAHPPADAVVGPSADHAPARPSAHLRLLGAFGLTDSDGEDIPVTAPRAQSLLGYLALHHDSPQSRARISFLMWPDASEAAARNSLRQLLHGLRQSWSDADRSLDVRSTTLALRPTVEVDLDAYEHAADAAAAGDDGSDPLATRAAFEAAAGLYRGDLLAGGYDDWVVPERERLASRHGRLLDRLVGLLEEVGDYRAAIEYGAQRLRLDPLDERVYRLLMRLHALNRDRAGALLVYQTCVATLERELGVEADAASRELYERIVGLDSETEDGLGQRETPGDAVTVGASSRDAGPLVGRAVEWAKMMTVWAVMVNGSALFTAISGEAGIGKSRLAAELVAWANRNSARSASTRAYGAEGRLSYAPVADWLRSPAIAPGLRNLEPVLLTEIARLLPELLTQHPELPRPSARMESWQRQVLFEALATAVLAGNGPLLLVLDDLQWCDADTIEWLHFLLRSDRHAQLLIAGTVRSGEVVGAHPLTGLLAGLRDAGQLTDIELGPLDHAETLTLAADVAGRPLKPAQAKRLLVETEGNPLFVVETVRAGLDDRDSAAWTVGVDAGTEEAPHRMAPKVQSVIAARLAQLSEPARELARLAATVGRAFSLEVLREAGQGDEDALIASLDELIGRHIVREQGTTGYDFSHDRIREVAYSELNEGRRRLLHRRVAEALERPHASELDSVAAQIAAQYAAAGLIDQATTYYLQAAEVAQRVWAHDEAIGLLSRGLSLVASKPVTPERHDTELSLQTALGKSIAMIEGNGSLRVAAVFERCRQLSELLGRALSASLLRELARVANCQARIDDFQTLANDLLKVAEHDSDPLLRVQAHFQLGVSYAQGGAIVPARVQFEATLAHYARGQHSEHVARYQLDPAVRCLIRLSMDLWLLGDPRGSARRRMDALNLASELAYGQGYVLTWDAILQLHRGEQALAGSQAEAALLADDEYRVILAFWPPVASIVRGWAMAEQGYVPDGIEAMQHGMADHLARGNRMSIPFQLGLLGEQVGRSGNVVRGLSLIDEALALAGRTNERWFEAELFRRKGDLLMTSSAVAEAESAYRSALGVARHQGARALELRAATRLSALWLDRGQTDYVAGLLGPIVEAFGATTDLPDLDTATTLLDQIGSPSRQ